MIYLHKYSDRMILIKDYIGEDVGVVYMYHNHINPLINHHAYMPLKELESEYDFIGEL